MSEPTKKLQRLLAQRRAIEAQINSLEERERQRQEKAIAHIIRRHKLTRFDPEKLDQALARAVTELKTSTEENPAPQTETMGAAHGG